MARGQKTDVEGQPNDTNSAKQRPRRVKPLGTITVCFPHVDDETRAVLQSVMDEAENSRDFTERLCNKVCLEPAVPLLQFLAFYFSASRHPFSTRELRGIKNSCRTSTQCSVRYFRETRGHSKLKSFSGL